jgi:hypothetical protein
MCFTGGFALAMMTEPAVVAPVLSQPSFPLAFGPGQGSSCDGHRQFASRRATRYESI